MDRILIPAQGPKSHHGLHHTEKKRPRRFDIELFSERTVPNALFQDGPYGVQILFNDIPHLFTQAGGLDVVGRRDEDECHPFALFRVRQMREQDVFKFFKGIPGFLAGAADHFKQGLFRFINKHGENIVLALEMAVEGPVRKVQLMSDGADRESFHAFGNDDGTGRLQNGLLVKGNWFFNFSAQGCLVSSFSAFFSKGVYFRFNSFTFIFNQYNLVHDAPDIFILVDVLAGFEQVVR